MDVSTPADNLINQSPAKTAYADADYCNTKQRKRLCSQSIVAWIRSNPRNGKQISRQEVFDYRWATVRTRCQPVYVGLRSVLNDSHRISVQNADDNNGRRLRMTNQRRFEGSSRNPVLISVHDTVGDIHDVNWEK